MPWLILVRNATLILISSLEVLNGIFDMDVISKKWGPIGHIVIFGDCPATSLERHLGTQPVTRCGAALRSSL